MPDYKTKHEFIDDNPYICYAPDADATIADTESGGGGGGGGDSESGVFIIDCIEAGNTFTVDKSMSDITAAYNSGKCIILATGVSDDDSRSLYYLSSMEYDPESTPPYTFAFKLVEIDGDETRVDIQTYIYVLADDGNGNVEVFKQEKNFLVMPVQD